MNGYSNMPKFHIFYYYKKNKQITSSYDSIPQ